MIALGLTGIGCALGMGAWLHYLWLIPQERVPEDPVDHSAAFVVSVLASVLACLVEPGLLPGMGFAVAVGCAGFFFFLMSQAPLPDGALTVAVGDALPDFSALDSSGASRAISEWRGKRVLLKFFRGYW